MGKITLWCEDCFRARPHVSYEWLVIDIPTEFHARLEAPCRKHAEVKKVES
jgi:hypothetical protein